LFAKTQTFLDKKGQHKPFLRYFIKVFFLKGGEIATQQQAFPPSHNLSSTIRQEHHRERAMQQSPDRLSAPAPNVREQQRLASR
jgi:hypothetical protein